MWNYVILKNDLPIINKCSTIPIDVREITSKVYVNIKFKFILVNSIDKYQKV